MKLSSNSAWRTDKIREKKLLEIAINFHLSSDIRALKSISCNGMKDSKVDFNASANRRATREREREIKMKARVEIHASSIVKSMLIRVGM